LRLDKQKIAENYRPELPLLSAATDRLLKHGLFFMPENIKAT
jgi:hypothetical protein